MNEMLVQLLRMKKIKIVTIDSVYLLIIIFVAPIKTLRTIIFLSYSTMPVFLSQLIDILPRAVSIISEPKSGATVTVTNVTAPGAVWLSHRFFTGASRNDTRVNVSVVLFQDDISDPALRTAANRKVSMEELVNASAYVDDSLKLLNGTDRQITKMLLQ